MTFEHIEIEKQKFRGLENPISINHVNIDRMIIPNGVSFGERFLKILLYTKIIMKKL